MTKRKSHPRMLEKLTAAQVKGAKPKPGVKTTLLGDGGNLYLKLSPRIVTGSDDTWISKSWIFRYRDRNTMSLRDMGLGPYSDVGLAEARELAAAQRRILRAGGDPISQRRQERASRRATGARVMTFERCADAYIEAHSPGWENKKHKAQWENTLKRYARPIIGKLPVNEITQDHLVQILKPIWEAKHETASRVRQRIEKILDYAVAENMCVDNPAMWRRISHRLTPPKQLRKKRGVKHHKALPHDEMYEFIQALRKQRGDAARCLEFTILTAARTSESIGTTWAEIDLDKTIWTVPRERMKTRKAHKVPLSDAAVKILKDQQGKHDVYVFSYRDGRLSNMAMLTLLKDRMEKAVTVHGFRSSFRDWGAEQTRYPREVCEMALAHTLGNETEAAYFRSDLFEKRRGLMADWAKYCNRKSGTGVSSTG